MSFNISVERDDDDILAVYIRFAERPVARTVEIAEGACLADEDETGNLLGVEIIEPSELALSFSALADRYRRSFPAIEAVLKKASETVNV